MNTHIYLICILNNREKRKEGDFLVEKYLILYTHYIYYMYTYMLDSLNVYYIHDDCS